MRWLRRAVKHVTMARVLLVGFLTTLGLIMLLPIIFLINHAFKPLNELFLYPPTIFVQHPTWRNFEQLFLHSASGNVPFTRYLFNSVLVSVLTLIAVILVSTMAGFVLAKHRFHFKSLILSMIMVSLMFVPETVQIPRYIVISQLGIMNTYFAHILPFVASPIAVFLMKQFIEQIPDSLLEAAKLDGASDLQIFLRIVIPLTGPAVATVAIITFQVVFGDVETSQLYMTIETMKTIPYYAMSFVSDVPGVAGQSIGAAVSLLMFLPNLILFLLFQRKMIETMLHSGVK